MSTASTAVFLAHYIIWIPIIMMVSAHMSQVYHNYKLKSTKGLSIVMINMFLLNSVFMAVHRVLAAVPMQTKIGAVSVSVLAAMTSLQELYYGANKRRKYSVFLSYGVAVMGCMVIMKGVAYNPSYTVELLGWVSLGLSSLIQGSQIVKNYKLKTMKAVSWYSALLSALSVSINLWVMMVLSYPLNVRLHMMRGAVFRYVMLYQFFIYKTPKSEEKKPVLPPSTSV